jgi:chromosome segregation protein
MTRVESRSPRFKSLELQGYKTFAAKTLFTFAPTITAIVGPNGTGKSNIADAIRWVLGEQAYSLLRGKKTEDMIFSGSELRSRSGMAAASITFDNADDWLPIEFSEVAVGRRAYRDGQNEYLINDQKVRLRDVAELLSESGLAERTYTVIGQGLVDAALSLRAEERRQLFEEAAGIGLYRGRREESVRRLETTRRNLERAQDILAELRPRLRSLERQAQRARDYEQVREDLRSSLRTWYGFHWNQQQSQLSEARLVAAEHQGKRDALLDRQQSVESKLELRRAEIIELRAALEEWSGKSSTLFSQRESLGRQVAVLRERIRWMEEQQGLAESELASLRRQRQQLAKSLEIAQSEVQTHVDEVESLESALEGEGSGTSLGDRRSMEEETEGLRRELESVVAREAAWFARQSQLLEREEGARQAIAALSPKLAAAEAGWQRTQDLLRQAQDRLGRLEAELEAAREKQGKRLDREKDLAKRLARAEAELNTLEAERARIEASISAFEGVHRTREAGTLALQQAMERGDLRDSLGKVVSMLKVDDDYRRAIASALGEVMGALALEDRQQLLAALEMLQSQPNSGRTVLLNLGTGTEYEVVEPDDAPGVLGSALDFVRGTSELRQALERLLGKTWIVANRTTALSLRDEIDEMVRLVTVAGEVFLADGTVIVGEGTPDSVASDLSTLEAERTLIAQQVAAAEDQLHDLRQKWLEAKALIEEGENAWVQSESERRNSESEIGPLRSQAEAAGSERTALQERSNLLESSLEETEGKLAQLTEEGGGFDVQRGRLERKLAELRRRAGDWDAADADARLMARWEAARMSLESARERGADIEARLQAVDAETEAREGRLGSQLEEAKANAEELEELQSQADAVEAQLEVRSAELKPSERKLQEAERRRAELVEESGTVRAQLQRVENLFSQAQVQLARREEELRGLQRRIEDDFGLVAYEYDEATTGQEPLPMEGLVEHLPAVGTLPEGLETQVQRLRGQLRRMGAINPEARTEHRAVKERVEFLTTQIDDLRSAESHIREVIAELDVIMAREFRKTFEQVAVEFKKTFQQLFDGGSARLELTDPSDPNATGIEIEARLPGKREQGLAVLSGGERSLAASALVFALLRVSPTPFCVLDEVDAMLDEVNVVRFCDLLKELSETTQFVVITHNRQTVQVAEAVYGVSMGADSTSKVISLDLEEAAKEIAA